MAPYLSTVFAPGEEARFLDLFEHKRFAVLAGDPETVGQMLNVEQIATLLANGTLQPPRIRLSRSGNLVPEMIWTSEDGPVDMAVLRTLMAKGATLVIDNLGPLVPVLLQLEHSVERRLGARTLINAYLTERKGGAFAAHYDNHDVLIIQVLGDKVWDIFEPAEQASNSRRKWRHTLRCPEEISESRTLKAGEMMFIPRGTWHRASVNDGAMSLHLAVTIVSLNGADYVRWLADRLEADDFVCVDIPRVAGVDAVKRHQHALQERITALIHDNGFDCFLADMDGNRDPVDLAGLAKLEPPEDADLLVPAMRRKLHDKADVIEARAGRQISRFAGVRREILVAVDASEGGLNFSALRGSLDDKYSADEVVDGVLHLAGKGLISIRRAGTA